MHMRMHVSSSSVWACSKPALILFEFGLWYQPQMPVFFFYNPVFGQYVSRVPYATRRLPKLIIQDGSFTIHGMADLEDVCTSLAFQQVTHETAVRILT